MNKCLKCGGELLTGDINGVCSKCRGETFSETTQIDAYRQDHVFVNFEPYRNLLMKQAKKMKRRKIYERKTKRSNVK